MCDILNIERLSEQVHRSLGDLAGEHLDMLITVGPRAKFIADEALSRGVEKNARQLAPGDVLKEEDSTSAGKALDREIKPDDLILVTGSRHLELEKAVYEIMAQPERAGELLVQHGGDWKKN